MSNVEGKLMSYKSSKKSNEDLEREIAELMEGKAPEDQEEVEEEKEVKAEKEDENLSVEEKTFKKRYADLRRHSEKMKKEFEDRIAKLEGQTPKEEFRIPADQEDYEAWMKENPKIARIVRALAQEEARSMFEQHNTTLEEFQSAKEEASRQKALEKIIKAHPDFEELQENDDFHKWAGNQTERIQSLLYDNDEDADAVIFVLDKYKADINAPKAKRKATEDAAKTVNAGKSSVDSSKEKKIWKESEIDSLPPLVYEKYMEEIDAAIREGRVEYDGRKKKSYQNRAAM